MSMNLWPIRIRTRTWSTTSDRGTTREHLAAIHGHEHNHPAVEHDHEAHQDPQKEHEREGHVHDHAHPTID